MRPPQRKSRASTAHRSQRRLKRPTKPRPTRPGRSRGESILSRCSTLPKAQNADGCDLCVCVCWGVRNTQSRFVSFRFEAVRSSRARGLMHYPEGATLTCTRIPDHHVGRHCMAKALHGKDTTQTGAQWSLRVAAWRRKKLAGALGAPPRVGLPKVTTRQPFGRFSHSSPKQWISPLRLCGRFSDQRRLQSQGVERGSCDSEMRGANCQRRRRREVGRQHGERWRCRCLKRLRRTPRGKRARVRASQCCCGIWSGVKCSADAQGIAIQPPSNCGSRGEAES